MTEIVLRNCGDELTRENVLKQATTLKRISLPLFLPEITVTVGPENYSAFSTFRLARFDGTTWKTLGDNVNAEPN